jgi:hypothetical protein
MAGDTDRLTEAVPSTLELEMRLVREAIALVASGGAPRVSVAGIRFGEALLEPARRVALQSGVRLVPLWSAEEAGVDILVEPIAP